MEFFHAGDGGPRKSTHTLIAALSYRFNFCEKRDFDFKGLFRQSEKKRPHVAAERPEIKRLLKMAKEKSLDLYIAIRILYDMAARVQDLCEMTYEVIDNEGAKWVAKKTLKERTGILGVTTLREI